MSAEQYDLRPHQDKALNKLSNGKILWGGVGTGKSRVAAVYYHKNEAPKRVYVITTAKKRDSFDWQEEFYRLGIGPATGPVLNSSGKGKGRGGRTGHSNHVVGQPTTTGTSVQGAGNSECRSDLEEVKRDRRETHGGRTSKPDRVSRSNSTILVADGGRRSSPQGNSLNLDGPSGLLLAGDCKGSEPSTAGGVAGIYPWVLTIDSWNNIAKYANVAGAFFIFDEQRLVGSGDWTRKFLRIAKNNNWILLSGTPGDTWMDYIPVFVANNFYKNRTAFKREHVVYNTFTKFPKVDRYINVGKLMRQRAQLLVEMPYERHTTRHMVEVPLKYDKEALEMVLKKRWHIYENRPLRDISEMFSVGRRLVNSDRSRIEMVQELWTKHPKLIIFYNFNYELEILRSLGRSAGISTTTSPPTAMSTSSVEMNQERSRRSWPPGFANGSTLASNKNSEKFDPFDTSQPWINSTTTRPTLGHTQTTSPTPTKAGAGKSSRATTATMVLERSPSGDRLVSGTVTSTTSSPTEVSIAEWNGHKHEPIPMAKRWLYLVQYIAGAEGWNCTDTDAMIMYSLNYSWKVTEQAYGRTDRLNTPFNDLWYYNFMSESFIDRAIMRSLRAKETFNEAKYARLFEG